VRVADLPGLIEGASSNRGLGHAFLKHTEKAKALALVVSSRLCKKKKPSTTFVRVCTGVDLILKWRHKIMESQMYGFTDGFGAMNLNLNHESIYYGKM